MLSKPAEKKTRISSRGVSLGERNIVRVRERARCSDTSLGPWRCRARRIAAVARSSHSARSILGIPSPKMATTKWKRPAARWPWLPKLPYGWFAQYQNAHKELRKVSAKLATIITSGPCRTTSAGHPRQGYISRQAKNPRWWRHPRWRRTTMIDSSDRRQGRGRNTLIPYISFSETLKDGEILVVGDTVVVSSYENY